LGRIRIESDEFRVRSSELKAKSKKLIMEKQNEGKMEERRRLWL